MNNYKIYIIEFLGFSGSFISFILLYLLFFNQKIRKNKLCKILKEPYNKTLLKLNLVDKKSIFNIDDSFYGFLLHIFFISFYFFRNNIYYLFFFKNFCSICIVSSLYKIYEMIFEIKSICKYCLSINIINIILLSIIQYKKN